jgi:TIR domain
VSCSRSPGYTLLDRAPRDIQIGADWSDQIIGALDESRALVIVFSSNANESHQVKRELTYAADREIPILPLRIENVLPSRGFRYYLGVVH